MSRSVTVREILDRLDTGRITALSAPGIIRALCDGIEVLEAEVAALRARVAELEAPGECASVHKLRALVYEAAREGYECGILDVREADHCTDVDAIADRLLTEARPGHRRDSGGPA